MYSSGFENACLSVAIQWVSVTPRGEDMGSAALCYDTVKQEAKCNIPVSPSGAVGNTSRCFRLSRFGLLAEHLLNPPSGEKDLLQGNAIG